MTVSVQGLAAEPVSLVTLDLATLVSLKLELGRTTISRRCNMQT